MKKYQVFEGKVGRGVQFAESIKEAVRFTRMELFAAGVVIGDEGWWAKEVS